MLFALYLLRYHQSCFGYIPGDELVNWEETLPAPSTGPDVSALIDRLASAVHFSRRENESDYGSLHLYLT